MKSVNIWLLTIVYHFKKDHKTQKKTTSTKQIGGWLLGLVLGVTGDLPRLLPYSFV